MVAFTAPAAAGAIQPTNIGLLIHGTLTPLDAQTLRPALQQWFAITGRPAAAIQLGAVGGDEDSVAALVAALRALRDEGLVFEISGERRSCNAACRSVLDRVDAPDSDSRPPAS